MCGQGPSNGKRWPLGVKYRLQYNLFKITLCVWENTFHQRSSTSPSTIQREEGKLLYVGSNQRQIMGILGAEQGVAKSRMEPIDRDRDPLTRILHEAICIQHNENDPKVEYFGLEYLLASFSKGRADQW